MKVAVSIGQLKLWFQALGPIRLVFAGSFLLSWIAVQGRLVNRDGILYLNIARTLSEDGLSTVIQFGELNFLPLLIAGISAVIPAGFESVAKMLNALFLAGTCALLVDMVRRRAPDATWFAVLVVLAMPAYNQYRNEILREYGFWFFSVLGFWYAMRWMEKQDWKGAFYIQFLLLIAALFRLEALAFFLSLMLWQAFAAPAGRKFRNVFALSALPVCMVLLAGCAFAFGVIEPSQRVLRFLQAVNPIYKAELFTAAASRLSDAVLLNKYSREEAGFILSIGLLAIIPMKFFMMMGIMLVPFAYQLTGEALRKRLQIWQPLSWTFGVYLLVLAAFVTHHMFLVGRYVSTLNLIAVPFVAVGLAGFCGRFPRWKAALLTLIVITMLANVISTSPRSTHILEAGDWLKRNTAETSRIGVENRRLAYYAGWKMFRAARLDRQELVAALTRGELDIIVLEIARKDSLPEELRSNNRFVELRRFRGPRDDVVVFAVK